MRRRHRDGSPRLREPIVPLVGAHRLRLGLLAAMALVAGLAEAGILVLIARIAFAITSEEGSGSFGGPFGALDLSVPALTAIAASAVVLRFVLHAASSWESAALSTEILATAQKSTVRLFLEASWALQSRERTGHLQELMTSFTASASSAVLLVGSATVALCSLLALLGTAFVVNAWASLIVGVALVVIAFVMRPLRNVVWRLASRAADADLVLATAITETSSLAQEIRIFYARDEMQKRIDENVDTYARSFRHARVVAQIMAGLYQAIALLLIVTALAVVYGAGFTRLAALGAVVLIMLRSLSYGQSLQAAYHSLYEYAPYLEKLRDQQRLYRQGAVASGDHPVGPVGDVGFDDVWFEYEPGQPVLRGVSFRVGRGEMIGIVGASGAGKSTLVQLLLRLREPTSGQVLVDGRDVRSLALDGWYERVTFVPQEGRLFSGTVAENIRFFRAAGPEDVMRVAKLASLHDEIAAWPRGYETPVGERGEQLSVGQRQRLCIARSLLTEPDVIVLDEPTSALDPKSESLIRETLSALAPRVTVFVIAHRLSTLDACDRIMVLDHGRLQGFDAPERLERASPFFQEALRLAGLK